MKITRARIASQAFFFALFLFLAFVTEFGHLKGYPVSVLLEADPLVGIATAITTHSVYRGLLWLLAVLIPTLFLGRVFCGWVCPFGTLHHAFGWVTNSRNIRRRIESNRYRPMFATKYYILAGLLVAAALGSLQIGLLDPMASLFRSFTVAVLPALDAATGRVYVRPYEYRLAWVVGFLFVFLVGMNIFIPRFFCRVLCPLGATLGALSRFSLWRIDRNPEKCNACDLCRSFCEGACDPQANLRKAECFVCMNCIEDCPEGALSFRFLPGREREVTDPDVTRRRLVFAALAGALFFPFARRSGALTRDFNKAMIRPPGSVAEAEFLRRCIKCDQCMRVCPTNTLQPALFEGGLEGIWTPILHMRLGYCELNCTLCGQVCPTGAIRRISIAEKLGIGEFTDEGPIRLGTAFYDRGRCLPWAMDIPCVVCEEVCPVSPKAVFTRPVTVTTRTGQTVALRRPYLDPNLCIGCGICEHECPIRDQRAIRVSAVGETRSNDRALLLN
jgi:polyferredoxin